jgi:FtsP/CotA-like multicopper oxidase with cupredoxin domain
VPIQPPSLADRSFDQDSKLLCFDLGNFDGILGDRFLVNGRITPTLAVQPRRYRFRVLDGGPARFYQLFLTNLSALGANNQFWQISNDGNLLPRPVRVSSIKLGVAERQDIIIDFSEYRGQTIYLENRLRQDDGRGPMGDVVLGANQGNKLLKFVVSNTVVADPSTNPATATFYQLPETSNTNPNIVPRVRRTFEFTRSGGSGWRINGKLMPGDCSENRFNVERNSIEEWTLINSSGGWQHPIHIHMEEFQILSRSRPGAVPNALTENARKDVVRLRDNETVKLFFRFRDWRERYPMHCHNTIHEDHAMMLRWSITDVGDTIERP